MQVLSVRYPVTDWDGNLHLFTAHDLYKRIMEDSKSDFNWIASATILVKICKEPSFPAEYAKGIKVAILNCFASINHRKNKGGDSPVISQSDFEAIEYCYNSLYDEKADDAVKARTDFLTEAITSACKPSFWDFFYHPGPTYQNLKQNFISSNVKKYISQKDVDFKQLKSTLKAEFTDLIEAEEKKGSFDEDERKHQEEMKKLFSEILL